MQAAAPKGAEASIASRTRDESVWVVSYRRDNGPTEFVTFTRETGEIAPLFVSQPSLLPYTFAPMEDVRIEARDGLELVGYLTRADSEKPTPLVLLVHGGPWARDFWGFNPAVQWLANRGYAVLQVNYRGSSGYSKTFLHKGDKQWGVGDMQHDLSDAVAWAVREGVALEDKVCIYGGSYGGYACLAGLTFTPDLYACGVDIVGPSNIKTLLDSIPPWALRDSKPDTSETFRLTRPAVRRATKRVHWRLQTHVDHRSFTWLYHSCIMPRSAPSGTGARSATTCC